MRFDVPCPKRCAELSSLPLAVAADMAVPPHQRNGCCNACIKDLLRWCSVTYPSHEQTIDRRLLKLWS